MRIVIQDSVEANILPLLPDAVEFIKQAVDEGGRILVHCVAGRSRSVSCVVAYLIASQGLSSEDAIALV